MTHKAPSKSVEWYTPAPILAATVQVLGAIDLDPCSNPEPFNVPAACHYTQADNGLVLPWGTPAAPVRVFCNPPFGRELPVWIAMLAAHQTTGALSAAILLVPNSTDTRWFQWCWTADAICFPRARLAFIGSDDKPVKGNTTGSALPYWGPDPARFGAVFAQFGQVVYPPDPPRLLRQTTLWAEVAA